MRCIPDFLCDDVTWSTGMPIEEVESETQFATSFGGAVCCVPCVTVAGPNWILGVVAIHEPISTRTACVIASKVVYTFVEAMTKSLILKAVHVVRSCKLPVYVSTAPAIWWHRAATVALYSPFMWDNMSFEAMLNCEKQEFQETAGDFYDIQTRC